MQNMRINKEFGFQGKTLVLLMPCFLSILSCRTERAYTKKNMKWEVISQAEIYADCVSEHSTPIANFAQNDSVWLSCVASDSALNVVIYNTTADTLFIFSGFLSDFFYSTSFIKQVDTTNHILNLSFLPVVPSPNHPYHFGYYYFERLAPQTSVQVSIPINRLLYNMEKADSAILDPGSSDPDSVAAAKGFDLKELPGGYQMKLEVAIYEEVLNLCMKQMANFLSEELEQEAEVQKSKYSTATAFVNNAEEFFVYLK